MKFYFLFLLVVTGYTGFGQAETHVHNRKITFPDIPGYFTLKCDFHIHTVFSDGNVWPTIRVEEAIKDGLDAISLTEHLEYQPHSKDIPHPDRNRSYEIASELAKAYDLLVIHGVEITRSMPPGHANAIFINDANKLNLDDPLEAYQEANRQGAFVFWNHPNWIAQRKDGIATLTPMHETLIKDKLLHGIEVVNDVTYSDEALEIAIKHNLSVIGTSDIHGLIDWQYHVHEGGHRPITLVMSKERTPESIKEALFAGRTIAWFNNLLVGKSEDVSPLIEASLEIGKAKYQGSSSVANVEIHNHSDAEFILQNYSDYGFHSSGDIVTIPAQSTFTLPVKTLKQLTEFSLHFKVLNALEGKDKHPKVTKKVTTSF